MLVIIISIAIRIRIIMILLKTHMSRLHPWRLRFIKSRGESSPDEEVEVYLEQECVQDSTRGRIQTQTKLPDGEMSHLTSILTSSKFFNSVVLQKEHSSLLN